MVTVNVYLNFKGNCRAAFEFYKSIFGGAFDYMGTFGEMPPQEGQSALSTEDAAKIMHVALPISKETCLMGSDTFGEYDAAFVAGNNYSISIHTDSKAEAERLFKGLSAGGKITMPLADTFWGAYFGMFTDKFGIHWQVNYDEPK